MYYLKNNIKKIKNILKIKKKNNLEGKDVQLSKVLSDFQGKCMHCVIDVS